MNMRNVFSEESYEDELRREIEEYKQKLYESMNCSAYIKPEVLYIQVIGEEFMRAILK